MRRSLLALAFLLGFAAPAFAQTVSCTGPTGQNCVPVVPFQSTAGTAGYPGGSTPVTAEATGTTAAVAASLPAVAGKTNYLCGVLVSPGSAATAITLQETITGLITGTLTWAVGAPVTAVGTTGALSIVPFTPCVPASAVNTAITVTSGALGTSGINNDVNAWGFVQ